MRILSRLIWLFILLGAFAFATATYYGNKRDETEQVERMAFQLTGRLNDQLTVLEGVRALFEVADRSDDMLIREYLRALQTQTRNSGFQGVGIAIATTTNQRAATEARMSSTYKAPARVWPDTNQDLSYPIILIEPFDQQNQPALGYDMYSEPTRRRAIQRAWTTGRAATSGLVQLVQDHANNRHELGFLIYIPVRSDGIGNHAATPDAPTPAFVYAPVRVNDFIGSTLGRELPGVQGLRIYAGKGRDAPVVYERGSLGWLPQQADIRVADTQWTIVVSYDRPFSRYWRPLIVMLLGIILSLLVVQLTRNHRRRLSAFKRLAEEKARHAEDRELLLGDMVHRVKNAFARVGALARLTVRESESLPDFERKFEGRLRALSDTKQMMVIGTIETLDLTRLIRRELELAGGTRELQIKVEGPHVHLEDEAAQTLSLVVHELVTNSIKYGALSGTGTLDISWERRDQMVHLTWVEGQLSTTPDVTQKSFGSQFIDSLIRRTLRGDWQRTAQDRQITVLIRWKESEDAPTGKP